MGQSAETGPGPKCLLLRDGAALCRAEGKSCAVNTQFSSEFYFSEQPEADGTNGWREQTEEEKNADIADGGVLPTGEEQRLWVTGRPEGRNDVYWAMRSWQWVDKERKSIKLCKTVTESW